MCGIAGIVSLSGNRTVPEGVLRKMADALIHRGPDDDGYLERGGVALANRRLSIIGLADGKQPMFNEDRTIATVYNGEFFDFVEKKASLKARGHRFATHCDTEIIPHLWEDHQEQMFELLRGQFALAIWDARRRLLLLARDRFGICPLFYTRQLNADGEWLLFASEIKALIASGMVPVRPDVRGLHQVFNFFAVPGVPTCFEGIDTLLPGHCLQIPMHSTSDHITIAPRPYWEISFPDRGQEEDGDAKELVDEFERVMLAAVERRLRADVPVVSYLSGGIDSSLVVAMASKLRNKPIPTFTVQIMAHRFDETKQAAIVSRHLGTAPTVVQIGDDEVLETYPELIRAAEAPVIDTSCTALLRLARAVHNQGIKVALTGEGSDEWLAGYSWHKIHRLIGLLDMPGIPVSRLVRRIVLKIMGAPAGSADYVRGIRESLGDHTPFQDLYGLVGLSRLRFFSNEMHEQLADHNPYLDLEPDLEKIKRWHPLNRSLYWGGRILLPGQLLSLKGDRINMHSSVETRYPFLDEDVFAFLARLHPRWKLRGFNDKYILRLLGERYLPDEIAWRPKGMFRAPLDSFFGKRVPQYVDQLLSPDALKKTAYFDIAAVQTWRLRLRENRLSFRNRLSVELGLAGVVATQLWHCTFIDPSLADLPQ